MPTSTPRNTSRVPLTRFCFNVFYLKTWTCPVGYFFDPANDVCSTCPIINCIDCHNLTVCSTCDTAHGYYLNSTSGQCQPCAVVGCLSCTDLLVCNSCDEINNYVLLSNFTCSLCDRSLELFANVTTGTC